MATIRKKVNTLDLIQQLAEQNKETVSTLKHMKMERSSRGPATGTEQHLTTKNVKKELGTKVAGDMVRASQKKPEENTNATLKKLNNLMGTESLMDKKFNFTLAISGGCVDKYDKLATGISYKLGLKMTRNKLMRNVLDDFINTKFAKLLKEIDQK